jgi:dihydrodipicolinate synthase/N-acetylneuraminate lyase
MKLSIKGIIPPVITPLIDNNTLDIKGLEKLDRIFIDLTVL